jgi:hypothetical protein
MSTPDAEIVQLWEKPGLGWEMRGVLEPALKDFENDPTKNKAKNLESLLSRLDPAAREQVESVSLKKPSAFYEKLLGALTAERELLASRTTLKREPDDFDAIAAGFQQPKADPMEEDDMDFAAYATPAVGNAYEIESRFVDDLLKGIRGARK